MPRFDNEGFNPEKRINNDSRDRSVPDDENYYSNENRELNSNVYDRQERYFVQNDSNNVNINEYVNNSSDNANVDSYNYVSDSHKTNKSNSKSERKKKGKKTDAKKTLVGIAAVFLALVVLVCGTAFSALGKITHDDVRKNQYVSSSDLKHSSKVKNILLLGVDARNPDDDTQSRSDSMMLISIDAQHNCVKMTSFLRDSWVYIPSQDAKQRLNAACSYDGYNGVVDTIEYNFGIDIDGYVVADFEMFKVLVDAVGGVEVDVTEAEAEEVTNHEYRYGGIKLDAGKYKLTGEQALAYCRIRKIDTDFQRALRQRTVMQAILKSVKSANPVKLLSMVSKCAPYIQTNLSNSYLVSVGISGLKCIKTMVQMRVPYDGTWKYATISGASVISIDVDKNKEMLIDYIYNKTADEIKADLGD